MLEHRILQALGRCNVQPHHGISCHVSTTTPKHVCALLPGLVLCCAGRVLDACWTCAGHVLGMCCAVCCSNTLVVDDLEEAKALCFGPDHHKVVTIDGTMFKPNGTFTGVGRLLKCHV